MANLKTRLAALEVLAAPKLAQPIHIFRFNGTPEQAAEIAELENKGERVIRITRAMDTK
ncbi:MAG: hypothetical protein ACXWTY_08705 [Methylobacter sp.]